MAFHPPLPITPQKTRNATAPRRFAVLIRLTRIRSQAAEVPIHEVVEIVGRFGEGGQFLGDRVVNENALVQRHGGLIPVPRGDDGDLYQPEGPLITGASNLGAVPGFEIFAVPGTNGIKFDVFPGAPAVTVHAAGSAVSRTPMIVFKGNYTRTGSARPGSTTAC